MWQRKSRFVFLDFCLRLKNIILKIHLNAQKRHYKINTLPSSIYPRSFISLLPPEENFFLINCEYVCMRMHTCGSVGPPRAGVTDSYEQPDVDARNLSSAGKAANALNYCAVSSAPKWLF